MPNTSSFVPSDGSDSLANDRRALMDELGMPADASWKRFFEPGDWWGPDWFGWTIDNFGMSVDPPESWPTPWPYLELQAPGATHSVLIQVWRSVAQPPDCPLSLERRWHPSHGEQIGVCGLERSHTSGDVDLAHRGIELLQLSAQQHRSPSETDEAVMAGIAAWARQWLDRHTRATVDNVDWTAIQEISAISWGRIEAIQAEHHVDIGDVKRRCERK